MKFVVSDMSNAKVYHRCGCVYEKRIRPSHRMVLEEKELIRYGYHACRFCTGLAGYLKCSRKQLDAQGADIGFSYWHNRRTNTLYFRTEKGFWKVFRKPQVGYLLYHLNRYEKEKSFEQLANGEFHRQRDVQPAKSVDSLVAYILSHDRAKKIMDVDYRKLPRRTQKQKQYYRGAQRRERRNSIRRVEYLLDLLEKGLV